MTKDRLNELRATQNDESSTLLANSNDDGHLKIEVSSNISRYKVSKKEKEEKNKQTDKTLDNVYKRVKEVKELLEQIEDETISLRRIQCTVLQSVFDNSSHSKLQESMKKIKTTSVKARGGLRELDALKISLSNKNGQHDRVMFRVLSTQLPLLQKQYVNAMTEYQNALVSHKEKTEKRIKEQLQIVISSIKRRTLPCVPVDQDVTNEELEAMLDKQDTSVFIGNYLQETMDTRQKLQDARERHKELLQLEIAITELHDMFIDMSTLVESQGEVIDRIENYVSTGVGLVENGKIELEKAEEHKQKARKKKLFLIICLGSILFAIILVVIVELYFTFVPS